MTRVVVLGGTGFFGRYLVDDLMATTDAEVIVGARRRHDGGHGFRFCDVDDLVSVRDAIDGAEVVVHCAGPFENASLHVVDAAVASGVHYVDISENRAYLREVFRRAPGARKAGVSLLPGCSVVPALAVLAGRAAASGGNAVAGVTTFAAPGTRAVRGPAMYLTMLRMAGSRSHRLRDGEFVVMRDWTHPQWVTFPGPVGRRLVYRTGGMADLDAVPAATGARTVEFFAGSEHAWLNRSMGGVALWQRSSLRLPEAVLLRPARAISAVAGRWGSDAGAAMFRVDLVGGDAVAALWSAVVADRAGGRIPIVLASLAVQRLVEGELTQRGAVAPASWLTLDELEPSLDVRGMRLERWTTAMGESG